MNMIYGSFSLDSVEDLISFFNDLQADKVIFSVVSILYNHLTREYVCILYGELDGLFDD